MLTNEVLAVMALTVTVLMTGCAPKTTAEAEAKEAYISAPITDRGVSMIERRTGEVSFCNTRCSSMGKIDFDGGDRITTQPGRGGDDVRLTNETRGEVITCTVSFKKTKDGYYDVTHDDFEVIFESGTCRVARVHGPPRPIS